MAYGTKEKQIAATVKLFWEKVEKTETCWIWTGFRTKEGYGVHGKGILFPRVASRMAYVLATGYRPRSDEFVLHSCDNPACVRPDHLRLGSAKDNYEDARARGRNCAGERHGMWGGDKARRGEDQGSSKLTNQDVELIIETKKNGLSLYKLAKQLNISYSSVKLIANGKAWRHLTDPTYAKAKARVDTVLSQPLLFAEPAPKAAALFDEEPAKDDLPW